MNNDEFDQAMLIEHIHSMSTGGTEELNDILDDLHSVCMEIQLSMVATLDGLTMASVGAVVDPVQVGAMCSELQTVCDKAAKQLQQGVLEQMLLKSSKGYLLLTTAGDHAVLAVMAKPNSNLGMVFIESQRAADAICRSI